MKHRGIGVAAAKSAKMGKGGKSGGKRYRNRAVNEMAWKLAANGENLKNRASMKTKKWRKNRHHGERKTNEGGEEEQ
jgi:hypothetical protein